MNNRVKEIRKSKNHSNNTLEKFGEPIGLKKSALSLIENGKNTLTEQNIKAICRVYNVNEQWLRTGDGNMFVKQTRHEQIAKLTKQLLNEEEHSFKNRLISLLADLNVEEWEILENRLKQLYEGSRE